MSRMRSCLGRMGLIVAGLVPALGAGVAGAQTSQPSPPAGWVLYRSATLGLEVHYPGGWHVDSVTQMSHVVSLIFREPRATGRRQHQVQFWLQRGINPHGLSIGGWYAAQMQAMHSTSPPPTSTLSIGGRPAVRLEHEGKAGRDFLFYAAQGKTDILTITVAQPLSQPGLDDTYRRIIASIEFLDPR